MSNENTTSEWREIDPTSLSGPEAKAYAAYKAAYAQTKAARKVFEDQLRAVAKTKGVADGVSKRLLISYNFGKLSIATTTEPAKAAKSSAKTVNWSQLAA